MPWCGEAMKEFRQGGMQGASRACLIFHLRPCVVSTGVLARGHDIPKVRVESGLRCIAGALRLQLRPAERSRGLHPPGVAALSAVKGRRQVGRTGRAGVKGFAMTFVDKGNWKEMESAVKFLKHVLMATDQKIETDLEEAVESYQKEQAAGARGG